MVRFEDRNCEVTAFLKFGWFVSKFYKNHPLPHHPLITAEVLLYCSVSLILVFSQPDEWLKGVLSKAVVSGTPGRGILMCEHSETLMMTKRILLESAHFRSLTNPYLLPKRFHSLDVFRQVGCVGISLFSWVCVVDLFFQNTPHLLLAVRCVWTGAIFYSNYCIQHHNSNATIFQVLSNISTLQEYIEIAMGLNIYCNMHHYI